MEEDLYNIELYKKFRKFVKLFMNTFYKLNATGLEYIPKDTNYLLAGNHLNILDSWVLINYIDENLRFMVDKKLYKHKLAEYFFRSIGTFPIDQKKTDMAALRMAIELLKTEDVVIFPEGKTHNMDEYVPFKPGVPKIAYLTKKTLIPFGINGSYKIGSKININFGEPIDLNNIPRNEYDNTLEKAVRKLEKL